MTLTAVNGDIQPTRHKLVNPLRHILVLLKVNDFDSRFLLRKSEALRHGVDPNDARCALQLRPPCRTLPNRSQPLREVNAKVT